jgi:hypothetical protein
MTATLVGAFLVISVWTLSVFEVGKSGDGANIGAGVILVAGYVITFVGLISLVRIWLASRSRREK